MISIWVSIFKINSQCFLYCHFRIDYFDDLASEQESGLPQSTAVDISIKNVHMFGVKIYCDEFRAALKTISRDLMSNEKLILVC